MRRPTCPGCTTAGGDLVLSVAYTHPDLLRYMEWDYGRTPAQVAECLGEENYEVRECRACGMCWQTYYPELEVASGIYDEWIDADAVRRSDLCRPSMGMYGPLLQEVVALGSYMERFVPVNQVKVLDYGMGWGSWLRLAKAMGLDAYGYETSPFRIANAASMGIPCLNDEQLRGRKFHIINIEQVLEHVPDPNELIASLLPLLDDQGVMKIGVPNAAGVARTLRRYGTSDLAGPRLVPIRPLEHVNGFTPKSLRQLAARHGLKIRRRPVLQQFALIFGTSMHGLARSIGRPLVRGVIGTGTSVVLSK